MKLPKRLIERRDAQAKNYKGYQEYEAFVDGYNQGVEDLMREVQGVVARLEYLIATGYGDHMDRMVLDQWHAFCEVEKKI